MQVETILADLHAVGDDVNARLRHQHFCHLRRIAADADQSRAQEGSPVKLIYRKAPHSRQIDVAAMCRDEERAVARHSRCQYRQWLDCAVDDVTIPQQPPNGETLSQRLEECMSFRWSYRWQKWMNLKFNFGAIARRDNRHFDARARKARINCRLWVAHPF